MTTHLPILGTGGGPYDGRVPLSRRAAADPPNAISVARAQLAGVELLDLSDSNPTRHGLTDPETAEILARAASRPPSYDPDPRGCVAAREALAEKFGGGPDDYWLTPGTSTAYSWLFALLTDPGERIAVPRPGYPLVEPLARLAGVGTVGYPAYYLHPYGWEYDLDALADAIDADGTTGFGHPRTSSGATRLNRDFAQDDGAGKASAVVVVHPNNPTGAYADASLAEACRNVPLIVDEVFWPFWLGDMTGSCDVAQDDDQDCLSIPPRLSGTAAATPSPVGAPTPAPSNLTFGLDGLSKLLAAPHLKLGWIRVSGPASELPGIAQALDRIADAHLPVAGPLADALPALLDRTDATVARVRERLRANLATACGYFGEAPYRVRRVEGGCTVLVDVPRVLPDDDLVIALLERSHLAVHPGWFYDLDSPGTLALSLLPDPDAFADGCARLRAAIEALG